MLSSTLRRSLLSLLAVSTVGTLGFSAAASLGVTADELGAGDASVGACVADLGVSFAPVYLATSGDVGKYFVKSVELESTNLTDCEDQAFRIALIGTGGAILGAEKTGTLSDLAGTTESIDLTALTSGGTATPAEVAAEDVLHISVVIAGEEVVVGP